MGKIEKLHDSIGHHIVQHSILLIEKNKSLSNPEVL